MGTIYILQTLPKKHSMLRAICYHNKKLLEVVLNMEILSSDFEKEYFSTQ